MNQLISNRYLVLLLFVFGLMSSSIFATQIFLNNSLPVYTQLESALKDTLLVKQLVLRKKKFNAFPTEVFLFKNIEYLDLSKNNIDSIPPQIAELKKLKVLILSKNQLNTLPSELFLLQNLEVLILSNNDIAYLSPSIKHLTHLKHLDLWSTNIFVFPEEMSSLSQLKYVDLRGISLNIEQQKSILLVLPQAKVYLSPPCNCNF